MSLLNPILLCVTAQRSSAQFLEAGLSAAAQTGAPLEILCVLPPNDAFAPDYDALNELQRLAEASGARVSIYYDDTPAVVAAVFAKHIGASQIVVGASRRPYGRPFPSLLQEMLPHVSVTVAGEPPGEPRRPAARFFSAGPASRAIA
ncbi:MAG: hypothetical protein LBJ11_07225 [Oscillospiraceae bacterium]|nr:hypothetical protein [Oscillospiraceae bacterium]